MAQVDANQWQDAMNTELCKLTKWMSWIPVNHPGQDINIITGKWVYCTKQDQHSKITGYCAQFVARSFTQQEGVNFFKDNTFAAVTKLALVHYFLVLAAKKGWVVHQVDVKLA
jgi:hypothetical protein